MTYSAGVTGLQIALTLLTEILPHKRPHVTIVASEFPGSLSTQYASPWAGGQWRTHAFPNTPEGRQQWEWDMMTYRHFKELVAYGASKLPTQRSSGVTKVKGRYVWDQVNEEI